MERTARQWLMIVGGSLWVSAASAQVPQPALFGVPLKTATRAELGRALRGAHMTMAVGGVHKWYDVYHVNGALKHASLLTVSFTRDDRFAKAVYVFPSFVSTKRLGEVVTEVRAKYGAPTKTIGQFAIGPVRVAWKLNQAFEIVVRRSWPNPTTYMVIENRVALKRMKQEQQHALAKSGAF